MDAVTAIVTGAGAPGIVGTSYSLRENYDSRRMRLIGTDIEGEVVGKYLLDACYQVPVPAQREEFVARLLEICEKEKVQVILPQVTNELKVFAKQRQLFHRYGVEVGVSEYAALQVANNKYRLLQVAEELGCGAPRFQCVSSVEEFEAALEILGYPKNPVVVKPPVSRGMRGLRILNEQKDRRVSFLDEKPTNVYMNYRELLNIFQGREFPELLVMEYLPGDEYSVDVLARDGEPLLVVPRRRIKIQSGITFHGRTELHERIIEYSERLVKKLRLSYAVGFQFKLTEDGEPKLLECNPRIQGTMVMATFAGANIVYSSVKLLLGERVPQFEISWDMDFVRYWGGISVFDGQITGRI